MLLASLRMLERGVFGSTLVSLEVAWNTEVVWDVAIKDRVNDSHCSAGVADGLAKPHYFAVNWVFPHMQLFIFVLFQTVVFVDIGDGEREEEGMDRSGDKGEEIWVGDAVYIVEGKGRGETECLGVPCQDFRVGFKRDPFLNVRIA
jgi:hypothetical protein